MPTIRPLRANHTDTVEIHWTLPDGRAYYERYTCPPAATREARQTRDPADRRIRHPEPDQTNNLEPDPAPEK